MIDGVGLLVVVLVGSFFFGSIPSAYLASRLAGKGDIRTLGSGNSGATNVYRCLGARWAVPVLLVDFLKGFVPVMIALLFFNNDGIAPRSVGALAGSCAVLGHIFTPWLAFRGGKGVATGAGAFTALMPLVFPPCLVVFLIALRVSRRMSVASLGAAVTLPVAFFALAAARDEPTEAIVAIMVAVVPVAVILAHAKNIARLRSGTEATLF